jgi:predicted acylesterase/phospholipase RssA
VEVAQEAWLWLYARPGRALEYMGRGRFADKAPVGQSILYLDLAGGRRHYAFRAMAARADERLDAVSSLFRAAGVWLADEDARIVLTLGGGGYRLFAAQAAVRAIERLIGERTAIHEVWGTSGGALLGYTFANGHDLSVVEKLGYLLYHGHTRDLPGLDLRTAIYLLRRALTRRSNGEELRPELSAWVDAVDRLCPPAARQAVKIPYYAVVSNPRWRHPVALAEPAFIPPGCDDLLVPCDAQVSTGVSMAVPLLLNPSRGRIPNYERDLWFDGGVVEENPVMLPFTKWMRDRRRDPAGTPRKLKLLLVNLNTRFSESRLWQRLPGGRIVDSIRTAAELIDLLLDSRTSALVRTLSEVGDVEIMTATLNLGRLSFIARAAIPALIRTGQILEGWQIEVPSRRSETVGETDALPP